MRGRRADSQGSDAQKKVHGSRESFSTPMNMVDEVTDRDIVIEIFLFNLHEDGYCNRLELELLELLKDSC